MENHIIGWLKLDIYFPGEAPESELPVLPVYDPSYVRGLQLAYNELEVANKQLTEINVINRDKIENGIKALQGYKVDDEDISQLKGAYAEQQEALKDTRELLEDCALNLGSPYYNLSSSATIRIDNLREKALDFLGVPKEPKKE